MKQIVVKHVSNIGTSHPVFGRLLVQTRELLNWSRLPKDKQDAVFAIYDRLKFRLLKCHDCYGRLIEATKKTLEEVRLSLDKSAMIHPFLIGLENEAETFLYDAKVYFRELLHVVNTFFATDFIEARDFYETSGKGDGKLTKWASGRFG